MRAFYAVVIFFLTLAHLAALVFDPRHRVLVRNVHGVVELARIRHAQFARSGGVGRNLVVLGQVYVEASGVAGVDGARVHVVAVALADLSDKVVEALQHRRV